MRLPLILAAILAQLFLTTATWADDYEDCKASCAADREQRDMECPSPYDSRSPSEERDQCLRDSRAIYSNCLQSCPEPSSPPPETPEASPAPMSY